MLASLIVNSYIKFLLEKLNIYFLDVKLNFSMMNILRKFQDPYLVVKFQNFFGAYLAANNVINKSHENISISKLQTRKKSSLNYEVNKGKIIGK